MALLDRQRRGYQIGRIRIGQKVPTANGGERPAALDTFRFTTGSRYTAEAVAELYGGEVKPWERGQFEVITGVNELGIAIPPSDDPVSQWYEMWNKGGCVRRCDSQREQISSGPCLCPQAEDPDDWEQVRAAALRRSDLAKQRVPQACKTVTRISVRIPDLPGMGLFRLDTGSEYAADEVGEAETVLLLAREHGVTLPAVLRIEKRERISGGETKKFPVPVLDILASVRDIVSGRLAAAGFAGQLPPRPGESLRALGAGVPAPAGESAALLAEAAPPPEREAAPVTGEEVVARARAAAARVEVEELSRVAEEAGVMEDLVDVGDGVTFAEVREILQGRWRELPRAA